MAGKTLFGMGDPPSDAKTGDAPEKDDSPKHADDYHSFRAVDLDAAKPGPALKEETSVSASNSPTGEAPVWSKFTYLAAELQAPSAVDLELESRPQRNWWRWLAGR